MALPDFIMIGAAKAGTTAVHSYLAEHPDIFMSEVKETNYFAYALDASGRLVYGTPGLHRFPITSAGAYHNLFEKGGKAHARGEASPIYLECPQSAARIHDAIPSARIICGLRNPVDRAYSDYLMYLRGAGQAFDASRDLSPNALWTRPDSHWMRVSRYHDALARYYDRFPRERIHVFLSEDLKRKPREVVQDIYRFIGVDPAFVPDFATPYNVGGLPASPVLERAFTSGAAVRHAVEPWLPQRALKFLRRLRASNMLQAPRLPQALRARLLEHFREDMARTSALTGIDLDHWLDAPGGAPDARSGIAPGESRAM